MSKLKTIYTLNRVLPKTFLDQLDESYGNYKNEDYSQIDVDQIEGYIEEISTICCKFILENNKSSLKELTKLQAFLTGMLEYFAYKVLISNKILILLQSSILLVESFRRELDFYNLLRGMNFYKDISYRNTVESISDYYSNLVEAELFTRDYKDNYEVI